MPPKPTVLLIDDNPDGVSARALELRTKVRVLVREPSDISEDDIRRAHVLLVDYSLENWPERDALSTVALKPKNGLALIGVLRAYSETPDSDMPHAFSIHSGRLHEITGGLTSPVNGHTIARAKNIDWAFSKEGREGVDFTIQVLSLVKAVTALHPQWPTVGTESRDRLAKLLGLSARSRWKSLALADVESCHPPSHDFAVNTKGLAGSGSV